MPFDNRDGDVRSARTEKALYGAMRALLKSNSFRKITVKDICGGAAVSRAAFYSHYKDKYDFLKSFLARVKPAGITKDAACGEIAKTVNQFISANEALIKNLFYEADNETVGILFDFLLATLDFGKNTGEMPGSKYAVLSNFYAGGMLYYIMWQIKNKFPPDVTPMNLYLCELVEKLAEWKSE